jgi:hypothetical protein
VYDRGNSGVPRERKCKRKKNNGEERKEGAQFAMWNGCSKMRERGRQRMDERNMEQEGQNGKRKGRGIERKFFFFFGIVIFILDKTVISNSKARRANIVYYTISDESA